MPGSKHDETTDLTSRLRQLAELDTPKLVAPRRPLDDVPSASSAPSAPSVPAPLVSWVMRDVVSGGGRMYALGAKDGPGFASATWLRQDARHRMTT